MSPSTAMFKKDRSLFRNLYFRPYNDRNNFLLQNAAKGSKDLVQRLCIEQVVENHERCVNSVHWNDTGSLLLTAGDDKRIVITNPFTYQVVVDYKTRHNTNIFCAKFLPTLDHRVISCGADGAILNLDLERVEETEWNFFTCHSSTCYEIETIPHEPNIFLSCSEDGTVRLFDLRKSVKCTKESCNENILMNCVKPVSTIAVNPIKPYQIAIATVDSVVRVIDRRKIITQNPPNTIVPECSFTVPHLDHRSYRITSLSYSPDGRDILASYSNEEIYLFNTDEDPNNTAVPNDFLENAPSPPPYRRIRLRGDWTDTGPSSRPSIDFRRRDRFQSIVMGQMSDLMVQILNTPSLRSAILQNWRQTYSPSARTERITLRPREIRPGSNNNLTSFDTIRHFLIEDQPENENNIEQSVSNDNRTMQSSSNVNNIEEQSTLNDNHIEQLTSSDSNMEQSTSNVNDQRTEESEKSKISEPYPVFDDFVPLQPVKAHYKGHRNSRTLIKEATFWGDDFIMSGSDCGHVFIWDRHTCEIVMLLRADSHVVNCIRPHPSLPLLATSGVENNVKLWSSKAYLKKFSQSVVKELVARNIIMSKESRDTVTVSPSLIVRMLTHFNQIRRA